MTDVKKKDFSLTAEQIGRLSSPYIPDGIRQDVWQIDSVDIRDGLVNAKVSIGSAFLSPTDSGGAHFTMFSANEIVAQLMVIYMHVQAGFEKKYREVWAAELHGRYVMPIVIWLASISLCSALERGVSATSVIARPVLPSVQNAAAVLKWMSRE